MISLARNNVGHRLIVSAITEERAIPSSNIQYLSDNLNPEPQEPPKVWLVRAGKHGEDEEIALSEGIVLIGFHKIPSLDNAKTPMDIWETIKQYYPDTKIAAQRNFSGQLAAFIIRMKPGDIVALPLKRHASQIALGRVKGQYEYRKVGEEKRHTRPIEWIRTDVPRTEFSQDLLFSLGAFMTVCRIKRNNAEKRFAAIMNRAKDPGIGETVDIVTESSEDDGSSDVGVRDVAQIAHDQIVAHIQSRFMGHELSRLVEAVLQADGYVTELSPPGPDKGVDILAGKGSLGLDEPRLCVQVKSSSSPSDVTILRSLQGTMQNFSAERGLLVSWGGFNRAVDREARSSFFQVRLWDSEKLVKAIYRNYDKLPEEIQTELPLKRVWVIVHDDSQI